MKFYIVGRECTRAVDEEKIGYVMMVVVVVVVMVLMLEIECLKWVLGVGKANRLEVGKQTSRQAASGAEQTRRQEDNNDGMD